MTKLCIDVAAVDSIVEGPITREGERPRGCSSPLCSLPRVASCGYPPMLLASRAHPLDMAYDVCWPEAATGSENSTSPDTWDGYAFLQAPCSMDLACRSREEAEEEEQNNGVEHIMEKVDRSERRMKSPCVLGSSSLALSPSQVTPERSFLNVHSQSFENAESVKTQAYRRPKQMCPSTRNASPGISNSGVNIHVHDIPPQLICRRHYWFVSHRDSTPSEQIRGLAGDSQI